LVRRIYALAAVFALVFAGGAYVLARDRVDKEPFAGVVRSDDPFPEVEGETLQGGRLSTSGLLKEAEVLVVNVWGTWCLPCEREQPVLQRVYERYRDRGVEFVGIDWLELDEAAPRDWIDRFGVTYPSIYDPAGRTAYTLGFPYAPHTFVVDSTGTTRFRVFGEVSEAELTGLIEKVLGGDSGDV
jgi:thiol-disulfide isomerase/thioredoxin